MDLITNKEINFIDCKIFSSNFVFDVLYNNVYVVSNQTLKKYAIFKDTLTESEKYIFVNEKHLTGTINKILAYQGYLFIQVDDVLFKYDDDDVSKVIKHVLNFVIYNNYIYIASNNNYKIKKFDLDFKLISKWAKNIDNIYKNILTDNSTNVYFFKTNKLIILSQNNE